MTERNIEAEWDSYWRVCQSAGIPPEAQDSLRKTFFSGAIAMAMMVADSVSVTALNDEIREFVERAAKAHYAATRH